MKKNPLSFLKTFSLGLKDGILILIVLAAISPFVYGQVLERTSANGDVVMGSVDFENDDLPIRPSTPTPVAPTATPSPTLMPTPTLETPATNSASSSKRPVDGGFINLIIEEGLRADLWTQVQWLAGDGEWYDVNGWSGHLTANHDVLWFVGNNHLGAEPAFRWLVYDAEGGSLLATSDEFHLPENVKETIEVTVSLPTQ